MRCCVRDGMCAARGVRGSPTCLACSAAHVRADGMHMSSFAGALDSCKITIRHRHPRPQPRSALLFQASPSTCRSHLASMFLPGRFQAWFLPARLQPIWHRSRLREVRRARRTQPRLNLRTDRTAAFWALSDRPARPPPVHWHKAPTPASPREDQLQPRILPLCGARPRHLRMAVSTRRSSRPSLQTCDRRWPKAPRSSPHPRFLPSSLLHQRQRLRRRW